MSDHFRFRLFLGGIVFFSLLFFGVSQAAPRLSKRSVKAAAQDPSKVSAGSISNAAAEKWIRRLIQDRKKINSRNFAYIIEKGACGYLQKLKDAQARQAGKNPLSAIQEEAFFKEVLRVYGKALDYTLDHNYFYCLYNYFGSPRHPKILEISAAVLSKKKQEKLLDRLKICHEAEVEGNGDNPGKNSRMREISYESLKKEKSKKGKSKKGSSAALSLKLLSPPVYRKMPYKFQKQYSNSARRSFLELEKASGKKAPPAKRARAAPMPGFLLFPLFPLAAEASLVSGSSECLVGGVLRKTVYQSQTGRYVCPTMNNPCEGQKDGFRCGAVFNEKCVSRNPVKSISQRCYEAAREEPVSPEKYKQFADSLRGDFDSYCKSRARSSACKLYLARMNQMEEYFSEKIEIVEEEQMAKITERTEAGARCLDCLKSEGSSDETAQLFKDIASLGEDKQQRVEMTDYLSNSVFEMAACKCEPGNDRCTRGCGRPGASPLLDCKGDKSKSESWSKCMRHTLSAMMKTIHEFIGRYCPNYPFEYAVCDKGAKSGKPSICDQGFVLPSALCALNLDGEDRYSMIKDREPKEYFNKAKNQIMKTAPVLKSCEKWKGHNKALTTVVILDGEGQPKRVPLFQKADMPADPEDLPDGSIVVMESNSRHGHIEIKTNKKDCGGNVCFCSDYCDSRKGGYQPPFKPLIAFQWNPEVLKYFEDNM